MENIVNLSSSSLLQSLCGLPVNTYFSAVKLRWLIDNSEVVRKAVEEDRCLFGTVDSWLLWVKYNIFMIYCLLHKDDKTIYCMTRMDGPAHAILYNLACELTRAGPDGLT